MGFTLEWLPKRDCLETSVMVMYNWWIDLSGFSVVRRDRTDRRGGGVCVYIRDNISLIISCAASWFGRSSTWIFMVIVETSSSTSWYEFTILGAIYHPPGNDDSVLLNHITESLDGVLCSHPNAGIIIAGDFNQFKHGHLCNLFNLKHANCEAPDKRQQYPR